MKKKILSAFLALSMLGQSVFAASLKTFVNGSFPAEYITNEMFDYEKWAGKIDTVATAKASVAGANSFNSSASSAAGVFDYKVTLDMSGVKTAFSNLCLLTEASIERKGGTDKADLKNQFYSSKVTGNFEVTVDYDANLNRNGAEFVFGQDVITTPDIFELDGAIDYTQNPIVVKFKIKDRADITVDYLKGTNVLNDLYMTLNGVSTSVYNTNLPVSAQLTKADVFLTDSADTYGKISFTSNQSTATVIRPTSGGGSGSGGVSTAPKFYTVVDGVTTEIPTLKDGIRYHVDISQIELPAKDGYTFDGWYLDESYTEAVTGDLTITKTTYIYAKFTEDGSAPDKEPTASTVVDGEKVEIPVNKDGDKYTVNLDDVTVPEKEGFAFENWYTDPLLTEEASGTVEITDDTSFYPNYINLTAPSVLISDDHIAYIYGYPDGEVKPTGNITREEVVAAFYRLLKPEHRATIETTDHPFPDVNEGRWSLEEIATMANGGYIVGDHEGKFNPSNPITRAEFVTIAVKFMEANTVPETNYFTDISGHWAEESILRAAYEYYWIMGYADGTFRPNNYITRAEAMTIINRMLVRYGDHTSEHAEDWPDLFETDWYYSNVIEATTHNHAFDRHDNGWSETWTGIIEE